MPKLRAPAHFARQAMAIAKKNRRAWLRHSLTLKEKSKRHEWEESRHFSEYDRFFRIGLGHPLASELASIFYLGREKFHFSKKRPLRVLEDGAGVGLFLEGLKRELSERKVPCETTALALHSNTGLESRKSDGTIDNLVLGRAEFFRPKKHFDVIVSLFGSISYALPEIRKTQLLKFAYSLRHGGLMLVGFEFDYDLTEKEIGSVVGGLSPKTKKALASPRSAKGLTLREEMDGISKAFGKMGFHASFIPFGKARGYPNWMLIVRRR